MSFVLLGRRPDGRCYLVSDRAFESRSEALEELSRITGDPSFTGWDDEIVLLDGAHGSPVLLVRPIEAPEVSVAGPVERDEPPRAVEEPAAATVAAGEWADEPETETIVVETPVAEAASERSPEEPDRAPADLREALARTAAQLEAEGVAPPPLVGPAAGAQEGAAAPAAWPWDTDTAPARDESAVGAASVPVSGEALEPEEHRAERIGEGSDAGTTTSGPTQRGDDALTGVAMVDPLEEPGYDEEPLIRVSAGADVVDAALSSAGTAIGVGSVDQALTVSDLVDLSEVPLGGLEGSGEQAVSEGSPEDGIASEGAEEPPASRAHRVEIKAPEASGVGIEDVASGAASPPLETMTCDECVYVETCPNSGQRTPASCGSFQWK